jgi:glycosyltransferase involved in cell wall biosynthesis
MEGVLHYLLSASLRLFLESYTVPPPILSIAMSFYNSAATLELTIRSMLSQSFGDFELLLPDDGSTDNSVELLKRFNDPRIICWSDGKRKRLPGRLNECIDRARGQYFARMDLDDIAYPCRLQRQLAFLQSNPEIDLCGTSALVFGKQNAPLWIYSPPTDHDSIARSPFLGFPLWHPTWMGKTDWFRKWRYYDPANSGKSIHLAEDGELLLRSFRDSKFANLPEILLGYRQETVPFKKLYHYKLFWAKYVASSPNGPKTASGVAKLYATQAARFLANCTAKVMGPAFSAVRQGGVPLTGESISEWSRLLQSLASERWKDSGASCLKSVD